MINHNPYGIGEQQRRVERDREIARHHLFEETMKQKEVTTQKKSEAQVQKQKDEEIYYLLS